MIEIMKSGEINPKKLTKSELDNLVEMRLNYYLRELKKGEEDNKRI